MGTLYRAQLLLEPEQHEALLHIARAQGRSVSSLVREILAQHLAEREDEVRQQRKSQAVKELSRLRRQIQEQRGVYRTDFLDQVREERAEEVEDVLRGEAWEWW